MRNKKLQILLLASALPLTSLLGQFSIDFTSGEGYVDGALETGGGSNNDWTAETGSTFTVDTAGTGSLVIVPGGGDDATFNGVGSTFVDSEFLTVSADFTLTFLDGAIADRGGPNLFQIGFDAGAAGSTSFIFRWAADFNLQILRDIPGGDPATFGGGTSLSDFGFTTRTDPTDGLVFDGDQTTNQLRLTGGISKVGTDFVTTVELFDVDTGTVLGETDSTLASTLDFDGFMSASKSAFLSPGNFVDEDAAGQPLTVDSFSVTAIPEPSTYAFLVGLSVLGLAFQRRSR